MFPFPNPMCASGAATVWRFNPADKIGLTLSDNNRTITSTGGAIEAARGTVARSSGKIYTEFRPGGAQAGVCAVGLANAAHLFASTPGSSPGSAGYQPGGNAQADGGTPATYATYSAGDIISLAADLTAGKVWYAKNGVWQSGDPTAGTGGLTLAADTYYGIASVNNGSSCTIPTQITYAVPAGFEVF